MTLMVDQKRSMVPTRPRIQIRRGQMSRTATKSTIWRLSTTILMVMLTTAVSQLSGPSRCPNARGVTGYSDLLSLQVDIARMSNMTGGEDGGSFVLCPGTVFNFSLQEATTDDIFSDDIFMRPSSDNELDPILIDSNSTALVCGNDGLSSDGCILWGGSFQVVILGGVTGISFSGLTFREAKNASIIYSGTGSDLMFTDCAWEENSGNGVILAVENGVSTEMPSISPFPSQSPVPTGDEAPTMSAQPTAPSQSQAPSLTPQPTDTAKPTAPTQSLSPSEIGGTEAPTLTPQPTAPTQSQAPSLTPQPTSTGKPTAPTQSLAPSSVGGTEAPTLTPQPTAPTQSQAPSLTPQPTSTGKPTAPTQSLAPSSVGGTEAPTLTPQPTAPTQSQAPSLTPQPTSTGKPTAPTQSLSPSEVGGTEAPTLTPQPTAPTQSQAPSLTPQPTNTGKPTAPTQSLSPSELTGTEAPTLTPQPTAPTQSQAPSLTPQPTSTGKPTGPTQSLSPSELSGTQLPTLTPQPTAPTQSQAPSLTPQPTSTGKPTSPTQSLSPSEIGGTEAPTLTPQPTAPTQSQSPSLTPQPTSTGKPTAPTQSLAPSEVNGTELPTLTPQPTAPTQSQAPSLTPQPTSTGKPTAPTQSLSPSDASGTEVPTLTPQPTAPTQSQAPSVTPQPTSTGKPTAPTQSQAPSSTPQPTSTGKPTAPTQSLSPSEISGTEAPTLTPQPTAPTQSQAPSLTPQPTTTGKPTAPTQSLTPSEVDEVDSPTLTPQPTAPTQSQAPSLTPQPTTTGKPTAPTQSLSPSEAPSVITARSLTRDVQYALSDATTRYEGENRGPLQIRSLQAAPSFTLSLDRCRFLNNVNDLAVVLILRGEITVLDSEFSGNSASGAIVSVFGGDLSLQDTTFLNNEFEMFPAPVFLDSESRLLDNDDNCGNKNTGSAQCNGVFVQSGSGDCSQPSNCDGDCSDFTSSECQQIDCFSDWGDLSTAISEASAMNIAGEFRLCNETQFEVDEPIVIDQADTQIFCGEDTKRSNNCVISGGEVQFEVVGSATDVLFIGITFLSSTTVSIKGSGSSSGSLAILDCEFSGHTGRSVVEIYNGGLEDVDNLQTVPDPPAQSMTVIAVNCTIVDNELEFAPVSNFNGVAFFDRTLFTSNTGQSGGMLLLKEGQSSISNCCFVSSVSTALPGMVFLEQGSLSLRNLDNFVSDNTAVDSPDCTQQFVETRRSCVENIDSCDGMCQEFSSDECLAPDFNQTQAPSMSPTEFSLSRVPSSIPSIMPTDLSLSDAPSSVPSIIPTVLPVSEVPSLLPTVFPLSQLPSLSPSTSPSISLLPSSNACFKEWDELSSAVNRANMNGGGGTFIICPNTELNVDLFPNPNVSPIVIASDDIIIQCGTTGEIENGCIVFGGERHFQIEDDSTGIQFLGVRFVGALITSINARGSGDAQALFRNCAWTNGMGSQAILVYGGDDNFPTDPNDNFVVPIEVPSMTIDFVDCRFVSNTASFSVLTNVGGDVSFERTFFSDNEADFGVLAVTGSGVFTIIDSCFVSNVVDMNLATVIIDENSTLSRTSDSNFGRANSIGIDNNCTAILVIEADSVECVPFEAETCTIEDLPPTEAPSSPPSAIEPTTFPSFETIPTLEPSNMPTRNGDTPAPSFGCFEDWDRLSLAILRTCTEGKGGEFVLCPGTIFDVDEFPDPLVSPIVIHSSDITVKCGDDGSRSNDCVISGGVTQFKIGSMVIGIEFVGVTFEKSRGTSIHAAATPESGVVFIDCEWRQHEGTSAILILELGRNSRTIRAMMVGLLRSNFTDNDVMDAAVVNTGGSLVVQETVFLRNRAADGAIAVLEGGSISVQNSCFVNNDGGAVTISGDSTIETEEGNFGFGNGQCNGILDEDDDTAVICGNACVTFSAQQCAVMDFDFDDVPTAVPTISLQPICVPSASPVPSETPTLATASLQPSNAPTDESQEPTEALPSFSPTGNTLAPSTQPTNESQDPTGAAPSFGPTGDTLAPSTQPTGESQEPTEAIPSFNPTGDTLAPSTQPTFESDPTLSSQPTNLGPTERPSIADEPTSSPSRSPSKEPMADQPTTEPSSQPTNLGPTERPSIADEPTTSPSRSPSNEPMADQPTTEPSSQPTNFGPTERPSVADEPTTSPSRSPSNEPMADQPTAEPSSQPTNLGPTKRPSVADEPTTSPSRSPSKEPMADQPTAEPSGQPTNLGPTDQPTDQPSGGPTNEPTDQPSSGPTNGPTNEPTDQPTGEPTISPTADPTEMPSVAVSDTPSDSPTTRPTRLRSAIPTSTPSLMPSLNPSQKPSLVPSSEQPKLSENPTETEMSFSFDYNFFYTF